MIQVETVTVDGPVVRFRMARRLPVLAPYFTGAYWVDGLLIDTGCAHTAEQMCAALHAWPVSQVVNTHSHEDHIGANAAIQEVTGCAIQAHPQALPILEQPSRQPLQPYRRLYWGRPKPSRGQAVGESVDTERFHFQVLRTPGHSPDQICLFEPDRGWLFTGDAYVGGQDRAIRAGYDIRQIIASLKMLSQLPVTTLFSGSGSVRENGADVLKEKIAYLEKLGEEIWRLHGEGLSARRIRQRLFGREQSITYLTLGHFSGMRLVRSYLAEGGLAVDEQANKAPADEPQA